MTQPTERRLIVRVHTVWKKIAGSGMPRRSQIDPRDFGTDWSNCMLIDLDPVATRSRFSHVGENLRDPTWPTLDRQCVAECLDGTLLELVTRHISKLTVKRKPVSFGGSAVMPKRRRASSTACTEPRRLSAPTIPAATSGTCVSRT